MTSTLDAALDGVRRRIEHAAGRASRDPQSVRLIAVTKNVAATRVDEAIAAGITDVGENRVQEASAKHDELARPATWHLIGHLQTNKARRAAELFDVVHSVDSERVAQSLATHRDLERDPLAILIEVDLTGMVQRSGVAEDEAATLLHAVAGKPAVHVMGLMTIAPQVADVEDARSFFVRLRELRDRLQESSGWPLPELSMGMSDDFEVAIEEGATMVRIGRAIFGERA